MTAHQVLRDRSGRRVQLLRRPPVLAMALLLVGCGDDRPVGTVEGPARSPQAVATATSARQATDATLAARVGASIPTPDKQILFGDLHVHTTYSLDAFSLALPFTGLQGVHTPAMACDFARHCAALDFFSITDHAENLTPEHWQGTREALRQCAAGAGENPDIIPFAGWEWTQVGRTAATHWGHRNLIFRDLADSALPPRPISSRSYGGGIGLFENVRLAVRARWLDPLNFKQYSDLEWLLDRIAEIPPCPLGVPSRQLPADCHESAPTPAELFARLDQWGFDTLVIPHGNTWGIYTPPTASWDKALVGDQHDPARQRLLEIMSGHGNSEEYRSWRPVARDASGGLVCPAPTADFLPCCWRAGELVAQRCGDLPEAECQARVALARQLAVEAGPMPRQVLPDAEDADWLDCGQCRDCFKPSFGYRPKESSQYAMALTDFSGGAPRRFRFGFIASSDDHTSRPGTGYKQYARRKMTFAGGVTSPIFDPPVEAMEDPAMPQRVSYELLKPDAERVASFTFPGGILAVHAAGRSRAAVWDALQRREVYGTSGPRILLWFDALASGGGPMGSAITRAAAPHFRVRAAGALVQKPGCPAESHAALSPRRLEALCAGECYHPGDRRHPISAVEVVRILPQIRPGEPMEELIQDPWRRFECPPDPEGCVVEFSDPEYSDLGREALYYVRALQVPTPAINGAGMRTGFDAQGRAESVELCHGNYLTALDDDCLAPVQERAWSSPIFVAPPTR